MGQTDSGRFFKISECRWHAFIGGVRRAEEILKTLSQPEADAPLGVVIDLDLPEWDIVVFEIFPQVSGMAAEFVDADLDGRHSGLATRRRRRLLRCLDRDFADFRDFARRSRNRRVRDAFSLRFACGGLRQGEFRHRLVFEAKGLRELLLGAQDGFGRAHRGSTRELIFIAYITPRSLVEHNSHECVVNVIRCIDGAALVEQLDLQNVLPRKLRDLKQGRSYAHLPVTLPDDIFTAFVHDSHASKDDTPAAHPRRCGRAWLADGGWCSWRSHC